MKKKFILVVVSGDKRIFNFIFKAKDEFQACEIARDEVKGWKIGVKEYYIYKISGEKISEKPNILVPISQHHIYTGRCL